MAEISSPNSFANETARAGKDAQLTDACLVIDALGVDAKSVILLCSIYLHQNDLTRAVETHCSSGTRSSSCETIAASSAQRPKPASSTTSPDASLGSGAY